MINILITLLALSIIILTIGCFIVGVKGIKIGLKNRRVCLSILSIFVLVCGVGSVGYIGYWKYIELFV